MRAELPHPRDAHRAELRLVEHGDHLNERGGDRHHQVCSPVPGQVIRYDLYTRVALAEDLPDRRLCRGDVATLVEFHPGRPGQEPGDTLEVFNAVGETVDVVTVRGSQVEPLTAGELLTVRPLAGTVR